MVRVFNTAGPCDPDRHYMLPPLARLPQVEGLIDEGLYFVIHAPRQTGKTTFLRAMAARLATAGRYAAVYASCESAQAAGGDVERAVQAVCRSIERRAQALPIDQRPAPLDEMAHVEGESRLLLWLSSWSKTSPLPVVLFLDEIDALLDASLISVLRQLRDGYADRPGSFPHAIALVGLRDVRDYRASLRSDTDTLGSASPFNIKSDSLLMPNFDRGDVAALLAQHDEETGQTLTADAVEAVWHLTRGQPWLVNALARQATRDLVPDRSQPIERGTIESAKEVLIQRRDTHLDSLIERLREPRVRRVVESILAGQLLPADVLDDDIAFAKNLGLVASGPQGLAIANPIYREIVPRALTATMEESLALPSPSYLRSDGGLDFDRLLADFTAFWTEHAESFLERAPYSEAAAQLVFMAFLHKITNGKGGFVDREYAVGSGRLDLTIRWPRPTGEIDRYAVELKVWRDGAADPTGQGIRQLAGYLARLRLDRGTLIVFDARSSAPPLPDRIREEQVDASGRAIRVLRL